MPERKTPAEWVQRVLNRSWKREFDTYEEMVDGIWDDTPGGSMIGKLSVLMLDLPHQHQHNGGFVYVRYNDVLSLTHALDVDRRKRL